MKILLLGPADNPHIIKWARSLSEREIEVAIFCFSASKVIFYQNYNNIKLYCMDMDNNSFAKSSLVKKVYYLKYLKRLKEIIKEFNPDIVHAHYASSYGLLGALSGFFPLIISVWGSDVYLFPQRNLFCKLILKWNLFSADYILSTSYAMAEETKKYTSKEILITPFGVDLNLFKQDIQDSGNNDIVVGTIKTLEDRYGVEYLIRAFAIVKNKHQELPLKLLIVGDGSLRKKLEDLTSSLGIDDVTIFTGKVPYDEISKYHNMLSIFIAMSESESFGVSVIEAGACQKPVIVADVGGLPEVVDDGNTGIVVPAKNVEVCADKMEELVLNRELREKLGCNARRRVQQLYDWDKNVALMVDIYKKILSKGK
ncbi:glycosyltransferase [Phascolarctobacterium sp.]